MCIRDRLEIAGNNEIVEIHLENLTSKPLRYMTFGNDENSRLLPYGLLLKARDQNQQLIVTGDLDYWRGYWSPIPYPTDLAGLVVCNLEPRLFSKDLVSNGMILAAGPSDALALATVTKEVAAGTRVK